MRWSHLIYKTLYKSTETDSCKVSCKVCLWAFLHVAGVPGIRPLPELSAKLRDIQKILNTSIIRGKMHKEFKIIQDEGYVSIFKANL